MGGCGPAWHPQSPSLGHVHGQQLSPAWPGSSQPGWTVSPTASRHVREESPLSTLLAPPIPAARQQEHPAATTSPKSNANAELAPPWQVLVSMPRDTMDGFSHTTRGVGAGRAGGVGLGLRTPGSSCWIQPFSTAALSVPATGNVLGLGLSRAWPCCAKLFIAFASLPSRNCPRSSGTGPGAWVPPVFPPPTSFWIPAR